MKKRWDLINYIIGQHGFKSYLEIGVQSHWNFDQVTCAVKVGVDPNEKTADFTLDSDEFFKQNNRKYDLIFIDGLHESKQVIKDIKNSLKCLNDGGIIVCHDMIPLSELSQRVPKETDMWNGDCWKSWVHFRRTRSDLTMLMVQMDNGCGVIMMGSQNRLHLDKDYEPIYEDMTQNSNDWMNFYSQEDAFLFLHRSNFDWLESIQ